MEPVSCDDAITPEQIRDCYCKPNFTKMVPPGEKDPICLGNIDVSQPNPYENPAYIAAVAVPTGIVAVLGLGMIVYAIYNNTRNRVAPAPGPAIPAPNALNARTYASANAMRRMANIESFMPAEQRGPFYRAVDAFRRNDLTIRTAPF